jgi:hypothetical protein
VLPSGRVESMKVRLHSFGQKWHVVLSSVRAVYCKSSTPCTPMKRVFPVRFQRRSVSIAAPIAPASPVCGCTYTSASGTRCLM